MPRYRRRGYMGEDMPATPAQGQQAPASPQEGRNQQARFSLRESFENQIQKVLARGQRFDSFDQIRQRHFWSTYLFAGHGDGVTPIAAGSYDLFRSIPGFIGQGYPVPLTTRETNWLGAGRVPDNQNFVITEVGVTLGRPPAAASLVEDGQGFWNHTPGAAFNPPPPSNSIAANLSASQLAAVNGLAPIHPLDAQAILYGMVLEMSFLTNSVPIGICADFSQSGGVNGFRAQPYMNSNMLAGPYGQALSLPAGYPYERSIGVLPMGDPVNGVPAAAFRRKLEVPILLQHGEQMGMRLTVPKPISCVELSAGGSGWFEVRVDWWATESFAELS